MKNSLLILLVLLILFSTTSSQTNNRIEWVSLSKAEELMKVKNKKIFVDLYTDWCGWCKVMDKKTFTHPTIISLMNKHFYAIKFDAEGNSTTEFNGKSYKYISSGKRGINEFANTFGRTEMGLSYPTTLFFSENKQLIQAIPGYLDPHTMEKVLTYIGEDYPAKGIAWEVFEKDFKSTIPQEKQ